MANKLEVKEFKNSIGQVIQPGDEVVIITSGYNHNTRTNRGRYLGVTGRGVTVSIWNPEIRYRHIATGFETRSWYNDKRVKDDPYVKYDYSIKYGTPEYSAAQAAYKRLSEERQARIEAIGTEYERFEIPRYRKSTLQLNRIFKIDTTIIDAAQK